MSGPSVAGRCDGVPFYIEQVVAGLTETGVPEALYEPLFARLRASANVVPVVEAAAVIGRQMDRGLLCSVVDLSDDEVDDVIDELEDALVLEPSGTDPGSSCPWLRVTMLRRGLPRRYYSRPVTKRLPLSAGSAAFSLCWRSATPQGNEQSEDLALTDWARRRR